MVLISHMYDLMHARSQNKGTTQPPITERISLMQFLEISITAASQSHHFGEICEKKIGLPHTYYSSVERTDRGSTWPPCLVCTRWVTAMYVPYMAMKGGEGEASPVRVARLRMRSPR